jgi:hypothetical protein
MHVKSEGCQILAVDVTVTTQTSTRIYEVPIMD